MKKIPPQPWSLSWQTSPTGRRSRFVVKNARGKTIAKVYNPVAAALMAAASEMESLLESLTDTAAIWRIMLSSEFGHNVSDRDGAINKGRELLGILRRSRY